MAEPFGVVAQRQAYYLQMMRKAKQLNDQVLIKLIIKRLARLGITRAGSATDGCIIIPFPTVNCGPEVTEYERPTWWMIFKLTLAIPGSLVALLLLAFYRM